MLPVDELTIVGEATSAEVLDATFALLAVGEVTEALALPDVVLGPSVRWFTYKESTESSPNTGIRDN